MSDENPVNPLPPVIVLLGLVVLLVELIFSAGQYGIVADPTAIGWRIAGIEDYGFSPAVLDWIVTRQDYAPELLWRFVTYPFVNGSFTQALFGGALLLALGKFVGDVFSAAATLAVFFGAAICGALAYGLLGSGTAPLFGLYPPVYGLIGAYTYLIWLMLGRTGQNQLQAFRLIAFLLGLQLLFGLIFGANMTWIADLAGFFAGFALSIVLAPGGWQALLQRLRN